MEILSFHGIDATSDILLDNVSMTPVVPLSPQLGVAMSAGNGLVFSWAATNGGFRLQASATLGSTNWVTLTNETVVVGTNSEVTLAAPSGTMFYRLVGGGN